jgi:hypothetical protein
MTTDSAPEAHRLPPITVLSVAALVVVVIGGIYMASTMSRHYTLVPAVILLAVAVVVLAVDVVLLARIRPFTWDVFFRVAGWALVAYLVIAGMIGYAFIYDGTRGESLALLIAMLAVFAVDVPVLLGFSVARHQDPGSVRRDLSGQPGAISAH